MVDLIFDPINVHKDSEIAETVALKNWPTLRICRAEVLVQGRRYSHPSLFLERVWKLAQP
jgi:hypothetical protein